MRDALDQRFLTLLAGDGPIPARDVAVVVAHPDDETIGVGAQLPRLLGASLVVVTDGAPRNLQDAAAHGFATAQDYAAARCRELEAALAVAGVPPSAVVRLLISDQEAALRLAPLARQLARLFEERRIALVLTHAYEGGHPDHDATAFAVEAAGRLLQQRSARRPAVIEMPFYHAAPEGWITQRFIPEPDRPELAIWLNDQEQDLKARMLAAHASQRETLTAFSLAFERFRAAPRYDFATLPNDGHLLYERYPWGLTGARWQDLVQAALAELAAETA